MKQTRKVGRPKGQEHDPLIDLQRIGARLKAARREAGYGIEETVKAMRHQDIISQFTQYYAYEDGKRIPTIGKLKIMAEMFNVTLDKLLFDAIPKRQELVDGLHRSVAQWREENPGKNALEAEIALEERQRKQILRLFRRKGKIHEND